MDIEKILKQGGRVLLNKALKPILKAILPYVLAIGGIALLLFLLYFMIFELPKQSVIGTFDTIKDRTSGFSMVPKKTQMNSCLMSIRLLLTAGMKS
ncbi:hypothetical protein HMSSN139_05520 [Paenibacillus sp. HMSSN-139]|nr:hypothetical protein HMSSN139_05520 [Paenibacillus sp. HMSSN-139]